MMNIDEKELQEQLKKETDIATQLKEDTWKNIEKELFVKKKKTSWKTRITVGIGTVAAAVLLIIISTSLLTSDQAGEQEKPEEPNEEQPSTEVDVPLEDQYEKEIQREREPEGQLEIVDLTLAVNEDDRYIIYVAKEKYEFVIDNGEGKINFLVDLDDTYPEVGITIEQHTDATIDDLIVGVKEEITNEEMMITKEETISYPLDAYAITAYASIDAYEWNSPVHHYYIYEAEKGVYFVFKQMLFMEALDGHNSIFDFMLETFEYVPSE